MREAFLLAVDELRRSADARLLREEREEAARRVDARLKKRNETEEKADAALETMIQIAVLSGASPAEIRALSQRVDLHQNAVIEALQENRDALDAAETDIEDMLDEAHVLPDGRRVFRTRKGDSVFDEGGREVAPSVVAPDGIDPSRPTWEDYRSGLDRREALLEEQRDLLDYQARLDRAEERIARGDLSREELEELNDLLTNQAPAAVRQRLPETDPAFDAAEDTSPAGPATDLADPAFDAILGTTMPGKGGRG